MEVPFTAPASVSDFYSCTTLKHMCNSSMESRAYTSLIYCQFSIRDLTLHKTEFLWWYKWDYDLERVKVKY